MIDLSTVNGSNKSLLGGLFILSIGQIFLSLGWVFLWSLLFSPCIDYKGNCFADSWINWLKPWTILIKARSHHIQCFIQFLRCLGKKKILHFHCRCASSVWKLLTTKDKFCPRERQDLPKQTGNEMKSKIIQLY